MSKMRQKVKEQTKKKILESASQLFLDKDFDLITTETIAQHAGVSKGLIFHHFKTKEQMGVEVVENILQQQLQMILPDSELSPKEKLRIFIEGGLRLAAETPGLPKLLIQIISRVGDDDANRIFTEGCIPYFQECIDLFTALNYSNPFLKAQILISIFDGLGVQFYMENAKPTDQNISELVDEIIRLFDHEK